MRLIDSLPENVTQTLIAERFLILELSNAAQESVRSVFDAAHPFFAETLGVKNGCSFPQDMGYRPFAGEYSQSSATPDQLESFNVCARVPIPLSKLCSQSAQVLYQRMSATFDILEPLAEAIAIEIANTLSHNRIGEKLRGMIRRWSRLQLNYSQPAGLALPFVNQLHEDLNLLTITCASAHGLEMQVGENDFKAITPGPEEALVFPGEIAWLLSGGVIKPLYHRVRAHPEVRERLALLFFADPEPSLCRPWISNSVNRNIDIGARVRTNVIRFGLNGFSPEPGQV